MVRKIHEDRLLVFSKNSSPAEIAVISLEDLFVLNLAWQQNYVREDISSFVEISGRNLCSVEEFIGFHQLVGRLFVVVRVNF